MSRLEVLYTQKLSTDAVKLLEKIRLRDGLVNNLMRVMANSLPVLGTYVNLQETMQHCSINERDRQRISLAVAEFNDSEYCLAIATAHARSIGMSEDEIQDSRRASSPNPRTDILLKFVYQILLQRGHVTDELVANMRKQQFGDTEIVEIIAYTSLASFTSVLATVAQVPRGLPKADPLATTEEP